MPTGRPSRTTLIYNAAVYTFNGSIPEVDSFAYTVEGEIIAVGTEDKVREDLQDDDVDEINMDGAFIMPGFHDVHTHVPEAGINMLDGIFSFLEPSRTLEQYIDDLAIAAEEEQPGIGWLRAAGASLFNLQDGENPLHALDDVFPHRPVLVLDDLGHGAMVNSLALQAAGIEITEDSQDPQGGLYGRDSSGNFNGLLFENAQQRVRDAAKVSEDDMHVGLLLSFEEIAKHGITCISDAGGFWTRGTVELWMRALENDEVTVRARNALYVYPDMPYEEQMEQLLSYYSDDPKSLVSFNTAKIYVDGILDLGTALMVEDYEEPINPELPQGFTYFNDEMLLKYSNDLIAEGFSLHYHVIGDGACRKALDMLLEIPDAAESRSRITHTYLVHEDDIPRFKEQSVIADYQMAPEAISDSYAEEMSEVIGERASNIINIKDVYETDAVVTISSDWDADPISPLQSIERALSRGDKSLPNAEAAIRMWTINAAYALGLENVTGSIEEGKFADYVVLSRNIVKSSPRQIGRTKVWMTVVGGRVVFEV